jgi:hypothetical protein
MEDKHIPSRPRAVRLKCLDCCCGNSAEIRKCPARDCPLWWYRMGSPSKAENGAIAACFQANFSRM